MQLLQNVFISAMPIGILFVCVILQFTVLLLMLHSHFENGVSALASELRPCPLTNIEQSAATKHSDWEFYIIWHNRMTVWHISIKTKQEKANRNTHNPISFELKFLVLDLLGRKDFKNVQILECGYIGVRVILGVLYSVLYLPLLYRYPLYCTVSSKWSNGNNKILPGSTMYSMN
jgi:hypothetical protein